MGRRDAKMSLLLPAMLSDALSTFGRINGDVSDEDDGFCWQNRPKSCVDATGVVVDDDFESVDELSECDDEDKGE